MDDILYTVFKFLSHDERKNARLVCRDWNRVCNDRCFVADEAFFFGYWIPASDVAAELGRSRRPILNLKFLKMAFAANTLPVAAGCGERVHSLDFDQCDFAAGTLERMLDTCPTLSRLTLRRCRRAGRYEFFGEFAGMAERGRVHQAVTTFHTDHRLRVRRSTLLPDLRHIFRVFANLKNLRISIYGSHSRNGLLPLLRSCLYAYPRLVGRLETLDVRLVDESVSPPERSGRLALPALPDINVADLRSLHLHVHLLALTEVIYPRAPRYEFWTSLRFSLRDKPTAEHYTFLIGLLNTCRHVRDLQVNLSGASLSTFFRIFVALVKSELQMVAIARQDENQAYRNANEFLGTFAVRNRTVHDLAVHNEGAPHNATVFLRHFVGLRRLRVTDGHEIVPQIFDHQSNLKALEIGVDKRMGRQRRYPGSVIHELEYLRIPLVTFNEIFSTTAFPNIKYVNVHYELACSIGRIFEAWMRPLADRLPTLEGIHFRINFRDLIGGDGRLGSNSDSDDTTYHDPIIPDICLRCCRRFRRLRYIWIMVADRFFRSDELNLENMMRDCFEHCTTLRGIYYRCGRHEAFAVKDNVRWNITYREAHHLTQETKAYFENEIFDYWTSGR